MMLVRNIKFNNPRYTTTLNAFYFAIQKKPKMELTMRTPYKTIFDKFDGFSRIITKTNEAALIIQNKSPSSLYVLPPGAIKVKLTTEQKGVSGDFLHLGGWVAVHVDNTCEINLLECIEKKDVRVDQFDKSDVGKDTETVAGRYIAKLRKSAVRTFTKKATL